MEMTVELMGKKQVNARFGSFVVRTDQPREDGGEGLSPSPFELFLASIATCAGFFIQSFCEARKIPTEGIEIRQVSVRDPATHRVSRVRIEVKLPPTFPEKYRSAVLASAEGCSVKKHLQTPPAIEVVTG